ncbi:hypothetical protein EYY58_12075 [Acinetobacter bereziniae]|uniref:hypothetical protein n=2 Tax=Moraxellaceae TaxID=468 RepID=UPI0005A788A8|nr:hypothetical protein EYB59_09700 [Acinetobacter bereziniae]TNL58319.1 hypothetical protein EYY58_12075 [Acinetobacter bereziniae]
MKISNQKNITQKITTQKVIVLILPMMLTGCFSITHQMLKKPAVNTENIVVSQSDDVLVGLAQRQQQYYFIGQHYILEIPKKQLNLESLQSGLNIQKMIINENQPLQVNVNIATQQQQGLNIILRYEKADQTLSEKERQTLQQNGFSKTTIQPNWSKTFKSDFKFYKIGAQTQLNFQPYTGTLQKIPVQISFFKQKKSFDAVQALDNTFNMVLAGALDVVTLPFQILTVSVIREGIHQTAEQRKKSESQPAQKTLPQTQ